MRVEIKIPKLDVATLEADMRRNIEAALKGGAMLVANDAKRALQAGPKSGVVYRRRGIEHQASAPGEPPATDTGRLVGSIVADGEGLNAYVEARTKYARWLEYGTKHMAARPFFHPALERNRARIRDLVRAALATGARQWKQKQGRS